MLYMTVDYSKAIEAQYLRDARWTCFRRDEYVYNLLKAARSVQLHIIVQNGICSYNTVACSFYHKRIWILQINYQLHHPGCVCIAIAITATLPQRVFPIVQDCPYTESTKCV